MRLLILGGTGFVGRHLVEEAIQHGHTVTLFNRGKTAPKLFPRLETITGDRDVSLDGLKGRTWDAAIDTNARMPKAARSAAAVLRGSVGHYTFISSLSAYEARQGDAAAGAEPAKIDENSPLAPLDVQDLDNTEPRTYGGRKVVCERWIGEEVGERLLVIRPGLIVGPHDPTDRFTYWPVRIAEGGDVLAPGSGADQVQFIDVRDLASWMLGMVERERWGVYNAVGPDEPMPMRTLLDECRKVCNPDSRLLWRDAAFLADHGVTAWTDMPVWLPGFPPFAIQKATLEGLKFRPVASTIRDTLDWALADGRRRPLKAGLDQARERQLLSAMT